MLLHLCDLLDQLHRVNIPLTLKLLEFSDEWTKSLLRLYFIYNDDLHYYELSELAKENLPFVDENTYRVSKRTLK